jgi:glycosyltransferase involved in cell wall biosynthesis
MTKTEVLFLCDRKNAPALLFAETLKSFLQGWTIAIESPGWTTLTFDLSKYGLVHVFASPSQIDTGMVKKLENRKSALTFLNPVSNAKEYRGKITSGHITVFSQAEAAMIRENQPEALVHAIPPCLPAPDVPGLPPSIELRNRFEVGDRFLVIVFGNLSMQKHFDTYLYLVREYQRRRVFRVVMLLPEMDKNSVIWRERLNDTIKLERLSAITLLTDRVDTASIIDSSDVVLHLNREREKQFDFLSVAFQALLLGKPLFCFNEPPVNEFVSGFRPKWVCRTNEDYIRESRDWLAEANQSEQISTEIARYAQRLFLPQVAAAAYEKMYQEILG